MRSTRRPGARPEGREEGQGGVATQDRPPAKPHGTRHPQQPEQTPPTASDHEVPPDIARQIADLQRQDAQRAVDSAISDADFDEPSAPSIPPSADGRTFRVDAAHPHTSGNGGPPIPPPHRRKGPEMPDGHRIDAAHTARGPHFDTTSFAPEVDQRTGRAESLMGQVLAYLGVGLLTVGTAVLLWGYFGGPVQYTPTGWLLATVGQMVLFLGVVTLISGGMQQTTYQVGTHVAYLDNRLNRIEHTTDAFLNGPHFASSQESRATVDAEKKSPKGG